MRSQALLGVRAAAKRARILARLERQRQNKNITFWKRNVIVVDLEGVAVEHYLPTPDDEQESNTKQLVCVIYPVSPPVVQRKLDSEEVRREKEEMEKERERRRMEAVRSKEYFDSIRRSHQAKERKKQLIVWGS